MDYKSRTKIARILIDDAIPVDSEVVILGLVRTARVGKGVAFVEVNDGSCMGNIQGVADPAKFPVVEEILTGAAIRMKGKLVLSQGKGQKYEVQIDQLELVGPADGTYPLQAKRHSFEFLRDIAHLRMRTNTFGAVNRIRSKLSHAIHCYFQERGFYYIHTPIISSSDAEGAGDLFTVTHFKLPEVPRTEDGEVDWNEDFFATRAFLQVSGQLEAEVAALALGDVYNFGPTFRAENSNTVRHASEFWMLEPEMAWAELTDNMDLAEDFLKEIFRFALEECKDEMDFFGKWIDKEARQTLEQVVGATFERITYTEAIDILTKAKKKFEYPVEWGADLQTEHERFLTEKAFKKPVIVIDYPEKIKPFYMRVNDDGKTVRGMDVLVPRVGEIIGGSQREERLDVLEERVKAKGMTNNEAYDWYLDLRRWGTTPHSGFGLGFDRAVMYITGMANIRDVQPIPRVPRWAKF